jgi:predicted mannosyl-3-phosphoglycerate phosphatase (HAD superfamily)
MRPGSLSAAPLPRTVLFSDVDGTLLDASDRFAITSADVERLAPHVELVLASSRTLVELADVQRRLGVSGALIAENGAVMSYPPRWRGKGARSREVLVLGETLAKLQPRVTRSAKAAGVRIVDQRDVLPDKGRSLKREYSICVRDWSGVGAERFLAALEEDGCTASRSGRWITITRGADKGIAARAVLAHAEKIGAGFKRSLAIGNAANDQSLLAVTQGRFAIRNPRRGHHEELLLLPDVIPLSASGKRAWREVLASILTNGTS